MARSTKLATAASILAFVADRAPARVTTGDIAKDVNDHPARVRQIVAGLVKHDLLSATRGAGGGVALARPASEITLRQIYEAIEDPPLLALTIKTDEAGSPPAARVHAAFSRIYDDLEEKMLQDLSTYTLETLLGR